MSEVTLAQLAAEIRGSVPKLESEVAKTLKKGAVEVKKAARASAAAAAGAHAAGAPFKINFDMRGNTEAEIGYDKGGQGSLGNLLEYGSVNNPPHDDLGKALDAEAPKLATHMGKAVAKIWR